MPRFRASCRKLPHPPTDAWDWHKNDTPPLRGSPAASGLARGWRSAPCPCLHPSGEMPPLKTILAARPRWSAAGPGSGCRREHGGGDAGAGAGCGAAGRVAWSGGGGWRGAAWGHGTPHRGAGGRGENRPGGVPHDIRPRKSYPPECCSTRKGGADQSCVLLAFSSGMGGPPCFWFIEVWRRLLAAIKSRSALVS